MYISPYNKPEGVLARWKRIQRNRKHFRKIPGYKVFQQRKIYSKLFDSLGKETADGLTRIIDDYLFSGKLNTMSRKFDCDIRMENSLSER
jgi:hypothetical protein